MYTQVQYDRSYLSPGPDSLDDSIEEDRRRWNADDEGLVATQLATQSQSLRTIGAESLESRKSKQESLSLQTESQAKELLVPDSQPASLEHRPTSFANRSGFIKRSHLPILNVPSSDGDVVPGTSPSSHSPRHQPSSSVMVDDSFRLLPTASTSSPRTSPRKTTLTAFTASTSGAKSPSRSAFGSAVGESAFPSVAQSPTGRPSSSGTVRPSNLTLQSSPEKEDDLSDGEEITFASTYRRTVSKPSSPFRPLPPAPALKREPTSDDIPDVSGRKAKVNPSEAFQSVVDLGSELNDLSDIAASSEDEGLAAQQRRRKAEKEGQLTLPMQKLMQRQVEFNASLSTSFRTLRFVPASELTFSPFPLTRQALDHQHGRLPTTTRIFLQSGPSRKRRLTTRWVRSRTRTSRRSNRPWARARLRPRPHQLWLLLGRAGASGRCRSWARPTGWGSRGSSRRRWTIAPQGGRRLLERARVGFLS